jgi:hypothetical protein
VWANRLEEGTYAMLAQRTNLGEESLRRSVIVGEDSREYCA